MKTWLILSYRANIDGSACSQHVDDRLPELRARGVEPLLLSGPLGSPGKDVVHHRTWSLAPSGIRFEQRHRLKRRLGRGWRYRLASLLLLPLLPFHGLEKLLLPLESEWSWCFTAAWRGLRLCRERQPELIYSSGGGVGAHLAAWYIARRSGVRWIAETQDPLVHDREWRKGRLALALYSRIEGLIFRSARRFVFLTRAARDNAERRTGMAGRGAVILPGSNPAFFPAPFWRRGPVFRLTHFGTLSTTRNLVTLLLGLYFLLEQYPPWRELLRIELYGSCDGYSSMMARDLGLSSLVHFKGPRPRRVAHAAMAASDCLLLVQDTVFFSSETIPSKVYEYLLTGRPILGLIHGNEELAALLLARGHECVPADQPRLVTRALERLMMRWLAISGSGEEFSGIEHPDTGIPSITAGMAAEQLMALATGAEEVTA